MNVLVTGGAGFIGAALCERLLARGDRVLAVDNLSSYYAVSLKRARLERLRARARKRFAFEQLDVADRAATAKLFDAQKFDAVMHLAAQAGVRYSLENPAAYVDANLLGFGNVLEGCRHAGTGHLVFASSSSVYGANTRLPFAEEHPARPPGVPVRGHQKSQRVDGPRLRPPVPPAVHRAAFFHRVRTLGAARYGVFQVRRVDARRASDSGVQPPAT